MKTAKVSRQTLRRSSLASFAIEGLKPSDSTIQLADEVLDGKLSREKAISIICDKYKVNSKVSDENVNDISPTCTKS